jgi:uncharacterized delta-60 repeat protein
MSSLLLCRFACLLTVGSLGLTSAEAKFSVIPGTNASMAPRNEAETSPIIIDAASPAPLASNTASFILLNSEFANLNNISLRVTGPASSDFIISGGMPSSLRPNASAAFTVTFQRQAPLVRRAVIVIDSSDPLVPAFRIPVSSWNRPPVALAGSITVDEDEPARISLLASDPDEDTLSYEELQFSSELTVQMDKPNGNSGTITPSRGLNGEQAISFYVRDGTNRSEFPGVFTINFLPVNDPPTFELLSGPLIYSGPNTSRFITDALVNPQDGDLERNQTLTTSLRVVSGAQFLSGTPSIVNGTALSYQPNGTVGETVLEITLTDDATAGGPALSVTKRLTLATVASVESPGNPDTFTLGGLTATPPPNSLLRISSTVLQPDGKILLTGEFSEVNGVARANIARLNPDGTLDPVFNPTADFAVECAFVQMDGKILIGGRFQNLRPNGAGTSTRRIGIARLNTNGTLDSSFTSPTLPASTSAYSTIQQQRDGRIICGGNFGIMRLSAIGAIDTSFIAATGSVNSVLVGPTGNYIIAGSFRTHLNKTTQVTTLRNYIARLLPDGALDTSFDPNVSGTGIASMTAQRDGKILLAGRFASLRPNNAPTAVSVPGLTRLNPDGTIDPTFVPEITTFGGPRSLALQTDGSFFLSGSFFYTRPSPLGRGEGFAKFLPDGAVDQTYSILYNGIRNDSGLTLQQDGKLFESINILTRLYNSPATQSLQAPDATRILWLRGGSSPEASEVTFELSTNNGTSYSLLGYGSRIEAGWQLTGITLPADGLLRARARVNGSLLETVAPYNINTPAPTLTLTTSTAIVPETSGSAGVWRLSRTGSVGQLFVPLRIGSSTASPEDFTLTGAAFATLTPGSVGTAIIPDGQSETLIHLRPAPDQKAEGAETVELTLLPSPVISPADPASSTITIAANEFAVTNLNDSGEGSLRQAILNANTIPGPDTITFTGAVFSDTTPDTIPLNSVLIVSDELTIQGPGANLLSLSGKSRVPVLRLTGGNLTARGLTVTRSAGGSGAISSVTGTNLTLIGCAVTDNISLFGGIYSQGWLNVINCTISGNTVISGAFAGAAITCSGPGQPAGPPALTVINSTISRNNPPLTPSTPQNAGGIRFACTNARALILNSTITENNMLNANIVGGLNVTASSSSAEIGNSIIAGNSIFSAGGEYAGRIVSLGHNLLGNPSFIFGPPIPDATDLTNVPNPELAPLADNGGSILTHAALPGSPALNAGNAALLPIDSFDVDQDGNTTELLPLDSRGPSFIRTMGPLDIGALEGQKMLSIQAPPSPLVEGTGIPPRSLDFVVSRFAQTTGQLTLRYTVTGSGSSPAAPADFIFGPPGFPSGFGFVTIPNGYASAVISIPVNPDAEMEPNESFAVTLIPYEDEPDTSYVIATASATGVLTDDDSLTSLTASSGSSVTGQPITLTATVRTGSVNLAGLITFRNGATVLGTGALNAAGTAALTISSSSTGGRSFNAVYNGQGDISGNATASLAHTVLPAATQTVLSAFKNPTEPKEIAVFTATVGIQAPGAGTLTGSVTFFDGANNLGSRLLVDGSASLITPLLPLGARSLTATYSGDAAFLPSTSAPIVQTVGPRTLTITGGNAQSTRVGTAFPADLTVLVMNALDQPVPGALVQFATAAAENGASATFTGSAISVVSNAAGLATAPPLSANTIAGPHRIRATLHPVEIGSSAGFVLTNNPGPAARFTLTAPSTGTAGTPFTADLLALDAFGNTATGYRGNVHFTSSDPAAALPPDYQFSTEDAGARRFPGAITLFTAAAQSITATDPTLPSLTGTAGPITIAPAAPASVTAVAGNLQTVTIDTPFPLALTAEVRDAYRNPIPAVPVTFTAPGSGASGRFGAASSAVVATTQAGLATAPGFTSNSQNGTYQVSATVAEVTLPARFDLGNGTATLTAIQVGTTAILEPQSGLYTLTVNVTNTTARPVHGFRLHVDYRAWAASHPTLRLFNATSPPGAADVYVDYPFPTALSQTIALQLRFYTRDRKFSTPFSPGLSVEILPASQASSPNTAGVPVDRIVMLPDRSLLLEWPATAGSWYRLSYSSDGMKTWQDSPTPVQAVGSRQQWIDRGPPTTDRPPADSPTRFYRVREIAPPN